MATLLTDLSEQMSIRLHDRNAHRHPIADRMIALSYARRQIAEFFGLVNESGYFEKVSAEIALAANSTDMALPTDFIGKREIVIVNDPVATGGSGYDTDPVKIIKKRRVQAASQVLPTGYQGEGLTAEIRDAAGVKTAIIRPRSSSSTRYFVVTYTHGFPTYLPASPGGSDTIEMDPTFDQIAVLKACIWLIGSDQEGTREWREELASMTASKLNMIQGSEEQNESEQVEMVWLSEIENPAIGGGL